MKFHLAAFADEAGEALSAQIAAMQRNGIEMLEMRGVNGKNCADLTLEEIKDAKKQLTDAGLGIWSLGSPFGKFDIRQDFTAHFDKFRHGLELCNHVGIERIRMFSFYMPEGETPDQYRQQVIDRLGAMLEAAKDAGIKLCHENEKGIYGDNAARCLDILKALPELGGIFDPANFVQVGQDTLQALELLAPHIEYVHIKDARKADGQVVPAGQGDGHVGQILSYFAKRDTDMTLTLEPHLRVFAGLSGLEREGARSEVGQYSYGTADEAFDAACNALHGLIKA